MRIWGHADPRLLNNKHLLGEHREVHALLNDHFNWGTNPEYRRFADLGARGRALLVLRHELLRVAMNVRWPNVHSRVAHGSPMSARDLSLLTPRMLGVLKIYERDSYIVERHRYDVDAVHARFGTMMASLRHPPCRLEGQAETPWDRDGLTLDEYLLLGNSWTKSIHHKGKPTKATT